jgi:CheY-like chemotaxis protein
MPVMDGMQATKIITERNPFEKIIFCTAHALEEFKEQTEAVGATHFISKPFRLDDIERVLQDLGH